MIGLPVNISDLDFTWSLAGKIFVGRSKSLAVRAPWCEEQNHERIVIDLFFKVVFVKMDNAAVW